MTRIVRLTRHEASQGQIQALEDVYGDITIETINESLPGNSFEAVKRFDEMMIEVDVAEVVLPINLIESILKFSNFSKRGGLIIRAAMENRTIGDGEPCYEFKEYEVIEKVEVVTRPLAAKPPKEEYFEIVEHIHVPPKPTPSSPKKERLRW